MDEKKRTPKSQPTVLIWNKAQRTCDFDLQHSKLLLKAIEIANPGWLSHPHRQRFRKRHFGGRRFRWAQVVVPAPSEISEALVKMQSISVYRGSVVALSFPERPQSQDVRGGKIFQAWRFHRHAIPSKARRYFTDEIVFQPGKVYRRLWRCDCGRISLATFFLGKKVAT
jgi:hypothetical protein